MLYVLLGDHMGLTGARASAAERIFQGFVSNRQRFVDWYVAPVRTRPFEASIQQRFLENFDRSGERASLDSLISEVEGRQSLTASQHESARLIVGGLRRMLARAAVEALEPDLVILDEFQRFRDLLDLKTGGEAAELAHEFFNQSDARVLLLSATPYKPFTYAEEAEDGGGHYADFLKTLEFLADSEEPVESLQADLAAMRQAALAGEPTPKSEIGCKPSYACGSLEPSGRLATRALRPLIPRQARFACNRTTCRLRRAATCGG